MSDRCIYVKRFLRDACTFLWFEKLHCPHIVQSVSEFDEHDTNVRDHGQDHFSDVFRLLLFSGEVADMRDLCEAVNKMCDLVAEITPYRIEINQRVLHDVVQKSRCDAGVVEPHISEYLGNLKRMNEVRLAGRALLPAVMERREKIRPPDEINVRAGPVFLDLFYNIFDPDHFDPRNILHIAANSVYMFDENGRAFVS
jgi:hypothetical protein